MAADAANTGNSSASGGGNRTAIMARWTEMGSISIDSTGVNE